MKTNIDTNTCKHIQAKNSLKLSEGKITWIFCDKCRKKVYSKVQFVPKKYEITTLCEKCDTVKKYNLIEYEAYPETFWECKCGNEVVIIAEKNLGVVDE